MGVKNERASLRQTTLRNETVVDHLQTFCSTEKSGSARKLNTGATHSSVSQNSASQIQLPLVRVASFFVP